MPQKRRKLNPEQIRQLRSEYEALDFWNPEAPDSIEKMLERWDISKPTLYRYRDLWMAEDEARMTQAKIEAANGADMNAALASLATELADKRRENERLRSELEQLQAKLDERGGGGAGGGPVSSMAQ